MITSRIFRRKPNNWKRFVFCVFVMVLLSFAVMSGGCGGSGGSGEGEVSSSQVSVVGTPSGELAEAVLAAQNAEGFDGLGRGDIVILAGRAEVEEYADDVRAAYERGAAVAVVGATSGDVNRLHAVLGTGHVEDRDLPAEIYAVMRKEDNGTISFEAYRIMPRDSMMICTEEGTDTSSPEEDDDFPKDCVTQLLDWVNEDVEANNESDSTYEEFTAAKASKTVEADVEKGGWAQQYWYKITLAKSPYLAYWNAIDIYTGELLKEWTNVFTYMFTAADSKNKAVSDKIKFRLQALLTYNKGKEWVNMSTYNVKLGLPHSLIRHELFSTQTYRFKVENSGSYKHWVFTGYDNVKSVEKTNKK